GAVACCLDRDVVRGILGGSRGATRPPWRAYRSPTRVRVKANAWSLLMRSSRPFTKRQRARIATELKRLAAQEDGPLTRAVYDRWRAGQGARAGLPASRALAEQFGS